MKTGMNVNLAAGVFAALSLLSPVSVSAQTAALSTASSAVRRVNVNVQVADSSGDGVVVSDQQAEVNAGHLYVPLRTVVERLGYVVDWDRSAQTVVVTQGDTALSLPVGGRTTASGTPTNPGAPAYLSDGKVMVPLRFMAETLGAKVRWNESDNAVRISRPVSVEATTGH